MARIRNIKPDSFIDYDLNQLPPLHRWLYPALWCHADRDGILEDKPRELKVKCLPWDDCDADAMLWDLHRAGFIVRYEVGGKRFIAILGFAEHQKFHRDEKPRGLPPPTESTVRAPPQHPADTLPARGATAAVGTDTKVPPRASTPDVGCLKTDVGCLKTEPPAVAPPLADPISAFGGTPAPAAVRKALGVVNANNTLRDRVEAVWERLRGRKPSSAWCLDPDLKEAFDRVGGDEADLLRILEAAVERKTYPTLTKFVDLLRFWDAFAATREPAGRSGVNARATQADRWDADYQPPLDEDGNVDLLQGKAR